MGSFDGWLAMSPTSPDQIVLTDSQRRGLDRAGPRRAHRATPRPCAPDRAGGRRRASQRAIAASLACREDTARKWRHRWCAAPGVASLGDAKRSGRRPVFTAGAGRPGQGGGLHATEGQRVTAVAVVVPGTGRQAVNGGICESISPSTVRRWLSEDALKPWQYQSWIFITDPDFQAKAQRVLDLYRAGVGRETVGPQTST